MDDEHNPNPGQEVMMSTMQMTEHSATDTTSESLVDINLEVGVVPVADVQR